MVVGGGCVRVVLPPHPRHLSPVPGARGGFQLPVFGFRCSVFGPQFGVFNFASSRLRVSHCGGECCGAVGVSLEGGFAPSPPLGARGATGGFGPRMRGVFFATDEHGFSRMKREGCV